MENSIDKSQSSVVVEWLESLHQTSSPSYLPDTDAKPATSSPPPKIVHSSKKRTALKELINGGMSGKRRRISPSKGERDAGATTPRSGRAAALLFVDDDDIDDGDDATPRSRNELGHLSAFPPPAGPSSATGDAVSWPTSPSSTRSKSPTKRLGDLRLMNTRVRAVDFSDVRFPLLPHVEVLSQNIGLLFSGEAVIPDAVKAQAAHLLSTRQLHSLNFSADTNPLIPAQPPEAYPDHKVWEIVGEILEEARFLKQEQASESAWNTEVHARLLKLVLKGWRADDWELCYVDVTTARIHSASASSASKMVDYAICVWPSLELEDAIVATLRAEGSGGDGGGGSGGNGSINHTRAEFVRFRPIAISIETKRPGVDEYVAEVQLGVWAAAHFDRLRALSGWVRKVKAAANTQAQGGHQGPGDRGNVFLPLLPQIFVQGHDWRLKMAVFHEGSGSVILYGDIQMGDTRSHLGAYKIIACLKHLCHWAKTDFRKWFVANCLLTEQAGHLSQQK